MDNGLALSERRISLRKQLSVRGLFRYEDGIVVDIKSFDASQHGIGVEHEKPLGVSHGHVALHMLTPEGVPVRIYAKAQVRHSHISGDRWRSGLMLSEMIPQHQELWDRILASRMTLFD
jgi:hypothetical protein